jgi:hypothetical protein
LDVLLARGRRVVETDEGRDGVGEARLDFLCECLDPVCAELVSITLEECEFVRRVPNRLVVRVGHTDEERERLLMEEPGRFQVIERFGPTGEVVAHIALLPPNRNGRAA